MSKSLGNFTTVAEALSGHRGEAVRLGLLSTHYRAPFDYSASLIKNAQTILDKLYRAASGVNRAELITQADKLDSAFMAALMDDFNTPLALSRLQALASEANKGQRMPVCNLLPVQICRISCAMKTGLKQAIVTGWIKQKSKQRLRREMLPVRYAILP